MTEPSSARPVPGPPRPGPRPGDGGAPRPDGASDSGETPAGSGEQFADLDETPVAEHVAVFEEEHSRLQRELGTIDQL
jgi:hypothetical protein